MNSDPIEFELFKNSLFSIADEMALTIFRTTYSGVLKDNMDYSTAMFDGSGKLAPQGLTLPGHLGSIANGDSRDPRGLRRQDRPGRRVHPERPVSGRHASAGHSCLQTDLLGRQAARLRGDGVSSHRCWRPGAGLERVGFDRDLPGRAAHPAAQALRPRHPQRHALCADRAQCAHAGQGLRRSARPAQPPATSPSARCSNWPGIMAATRLGAT